MVKKEEVYEGFFSNQFVKISLVVILALILVLIGVYFYLSLQFKAGDIVFLKSEVNTLGVVKAFSFNQFGFVVAWNDGSLTTESFSAIEKISKLNLADINKSSNVSGSNNNPDFSDYNSKGTRTDLNDFSDYTYQSYGGENTAGIFYRGFLLDVMLNNNSCTPDFYCGTWSKCSLDYGLNPLSEGDLTRGVQYHVCVDNNECLPQFVDSRSCSLAENITVIKKIVCGREKIILVDAKGIILSSLDRGVRDNFVNVDVRLVPSTEEGC